MKKITLLILCLFSIMVQSQTITTVFSGQTWNTKGLAVWENDLYIATSFDGDIYKLDLSQPDAVATIAFSGLPSIKDIFIYDHILYVSTDVNFQNGKILSKDLGDPNSLFEEIVQVPDPEGITVDQNILYVSDGPEILRMDLASGASSLAVFADGLGTTFGTIGLVVKDGLLYTSGSGQIRVFDTSEQTAEPTVFASGLGNVTGITFAPNGNLYATSSFPNALYQIDPTDGSQTTIATNITISNWDMVYHDGSVYVANLEGGDVVRVSSEFLSTEAVSLAQIAVYPNPTSATVRFDKGEFAGLSDASGREIARNVSGKTVDIADLSNGLYFLKLASEGKISTHRIIRN